MTSVTLTNTYDTIGRRTAVADILGDAQASRFVIQDFRPLAQSVEWELGQAYLDRGSKAFAGESHIPFAVNNDGNLSVDAAEMLFDNLRTKEDRGMLHPQFRVLELGPGLGLFARYFVDAFRDLCRERGKDYYDRLTYVAGDRSEKMLADIGRRGVFANHLGHYELRVVDALRPDEFLRSNHDHSGNQFHAIFLNYLLDALPATALKIDPSPPTPLPEAPEAGRGETAARPRGPTSLLSTPMRILRRKAGRGRLSVTCEFCSSITRNTQIIRSSCSIWA